MPLTVGQVAPQRVASARRDSLSQPSSGLDRQPSGDAKNASPSNHKPQQRTRDVLRAPKLGILLIAAVLLVAATKEAMDAYQTLFRGDTKQQQEQDEDLMQLVRRRRPNDMEEQDDGGVKAETNENEELDVMIPGALEYLANVEESKRASDRALFWAVPRSGGSTVKSIVAHCFGLTIASEAGADALSNELAVMTDLEGGKYLNVDVSTVAGIESAQALHLVDSPQLDLIATPYLHEVSHKLLSKQHQGRAFTMLRHPIDRSASIYYYLSNDPIEDLVSPGMSLVEYAKSDLAESNWYTRFLTGVMEGDLTRKHLAIAKEVLRTKFIVGLLSRKGESLRRFELFFEWTIANERMEECHGRLLDWDWPNKNKHPPIKEGSEAWRTLMKNNEFDLQVYEFAEKLFLEQSSIFKSTEIRP